MAVPSRNVPKNKSKTAMITQNTTEFMFMVVISLTMADDRLE
ncbi:hypothetical protein SDC9_208822 [bioreactor metagenome]|uniref:Uncharacterized protein n=1 Tax=bioreactor metagenome TaxID=1076179 RepID=A0A645JBM7_9ZZZZ